jgi:hypothetical protein
MKRPLPLVCEPMTGSLPLANTLTIRSTFHAKAQHMALPPLPLIVPKGDIQC